MPSLLTAVHPRFPLVPLLVGLVCAQAACNLGSLDYLQNGTKQDGGDGDGQGTSNQDSTSPGETPLADRPDGTVLDAKASEVPLGSDGSGDLFTNIPVLDAQEESKSDLGTDTFIPDTKSPDGALPDATINGCLVSSPPSTPSWPRSSSSCHRARTAVCGRPRAYMRRFGLCRICFRERALLGELPGVTKSSW